jgi:glycosyltransferase involved in cell wall biosynthesis
MKRICLNMIVKNEAHVIERCLASVRPFIDSWVIVDTGSTDGTQERIRKALADLPGELHERPWKNFGHNRSEAIELARPHGDYVFTIDADDWLHLPPGYRRPELTGDAYVLQLEHDNLRYTRLCLVASRKPWRWVGVLHEYLDCGEPIAPVLLHGPVIRFGGDGARSQQDLRVKYAADAKLLEAALKEEPDNARYVFYLAQSYRDAGQFDAALREYERRARMGGWGEEVFYSLYRCALLAEQLQHPFGEVVERFLHAYEFRPARGGEALGQLARFCRGHKRYHSARMYAAQAMAIPLPKDVLFVEPAWYQWRCRDEFAVASFWAGDPESSLRVSEELLADGTLPESERERVRANAEFARAKLAR